MFEQHGPAFAPGFLFGQQLHFSPAR